MANQLLSINTSTTNVTTSAYVTLVAATTIPTASLLCTDTTGRILKLAVGAAGQEVDLFQLPVSGSIEIPLGSLSMIPVGARLSLKAINANATAGFSCATLLS